MDWTDLLPFTDLGGVPSPRRFGALLAFSALFDLALVLFVLLRRPPRPIGVTRVALAVAAVTATLPIDLAVFHATGQAESGVGGAIFGTFAMIHAAWHDVVLVTPAVALVGLLVARKRLTRPAFAVAVGALAAAPIGVYARFVEPTRLRIERVDVPVRAAARTGAPLRVAVLSDLQTDEVTDHERRAFAAIEEASPDLILVPGDLFQGCQRRFDEVKEELRALLRRLDAPGGVWFVYGDVDLRFRVEEMLEGSRIRVLENEIAETEVRGRRVVLCGLERHFDNDRARRTLDELLARPDPTEVRIVFAHHPHAVDLLPAGAAVDLTVGGHTHGGQVSIPLFGPPMTLCPLPRRLAAGGLHERNGNRLYVSRGVGHERGYAPRIRFLVPPELSVLTLDPAGTGDPDGTR